jgi:hypothetical protein
MNRRGGSGAAKGGTLVVARAGEERGAYLHGESKGSTGDHKGPPIHLPATLAPTPGPN